MHFVTAGKLKSTAENKDGSSIVQRRRKLLSTHQKRVLEMKFALSPYASMKQQEELTVELGMTKREVQVRNFSFGYNCN